MTRQPGVRLASRRVFAGRVISVDVDTIRAPDQSAIELEIVRHGGAAAVVPMLGDPAGPDPQILMLRQYRYAAGGVLWEIPAGVLQPGEEPSAAAHRELKEETGARAGRIEHLTTVFTTPGFTDEQIHLFWATDLTLGEPKHEPDEFIELRTEKLSKVLDMIRSGDVADAKSIVALLYVAGFRLNM